MFQLLLEENILPGITNQRDKIQKQLHSEKAHCKALISGASMKTAEGKSFSEELRLY